MPVHTSLPLTLGAIMHGYRKYGTFVAGDQFYAVCHWVMEAMQFSDNFIGQSSDVVYNSVVLK